MSGSFVDVLLELVKKLDSGSATVILPFVVVALVVVEVAGRPHTNNGLYVIAALCLALWGVIFLVRYLERPDPGLDEGDERAVLAAMVSARDNVAKRLQRDPARQDGVAG